MTDVLHAWALAPAAVGTCCLAADRRRVRAPELAASLLMLVAMLDVAVTRALAPVWWAAILMAAAVTLSAWRGARRSDPERPDPRRTAHAMTTLSAIGMVVMAGLLLPMTTHATPTAGHDHHGVGMVGLVSALVAAAVFYGLGSGWTAIRARRVLDRVQFATMGLSVVAMAVPLLV